MKEFGSEDKTVMATINAVAQNTDANSDIPSQAVG